MPSTAVIVVAAGSGARLGFGLPKALVPLNGVSLLRRALGPIVERGDLAVIVAPETHLAQAEQEARTAGLAAERCVVVAGGISRQESVARGLSALQAHPLGAGVDVVLVHDAARALAPRELFDSVETAVRADSCGVVPALEVVDTIKSVDSVGAVTGTVDRSILRRAQTPQGFPRAAFEAAHREVTAEHTDDVALFADHGGYVRTVTGDELALKITTPADLDWAIGTIGAPHGSTIGPAQRVGIGLDAHAFSTDPNAELWLAGLLWPNEPGLDGHSDGDVAAHALVDALLGAAGLGDIGGMFGTDDPALAGARGEVFLKHARAKVEAAGWRILSASVEIVGNRPKIGPRRTEAETLLSTLLDAPVSLAATTSDGLGLSGEGRGIGASAVVLLGSAN